MRIPFSSATPRRIDCRRVLRAGAGRQRAMRDDQLDAEDRTRIGINGMFDVLAYLSLS